MGIVDDSSQSMNVLVTGGAGFIGSALMRHLLGTRSVRAWNVDCLTYAGNPDALGELANSPRYRFFKVDICDEAALRRAVRDAAPDAVVHLAAESHVDRSIDGPAQFIMTNIVGTYHVLEAALEYWRTLAGRRKERFRLHHVSTDEVFGSCAEGGFFTEQTPYRPNSPYSASKAAADHLVRSWHRTYELPVVITNCSNNYGPYQFPEKLIPLTILSAIRQKPLPVYGDGGNVRDWLYVDDHCRALMRVLESGAIGETYIIGGRAQMTNRTVVTKICALLDEFRPRSDGRSYYEQLTYVTDRPGHDRRYAIDPTKIEQELGWSPQETFDSGLRKTVQWYLDNEAWCREIEAKRYAGERLGLLA